MSNFYIPNNLNEAKSALINGSENIYHLLESVKTGYANIEMIDVFVKIAGSKLSLEATPHLISYHENKLITCEYHKEDEDLSNALHSYNDKPAHITFKDGIIIAERYYKNSKLHRENGPALVKYSQDGKEKIFEAYFYENVIDRNSENTIKPVAISYENNEATSVWYKIPLDTSKMLQKLGYYKTYSNGYLIHIDLKSGYIEQTHSKDLNKSENMFLEG